MSKDKMREIDAEITKLKSEFNRKVSELKKLKRELKDELNASRQAAEDEGESTTIDSGDTAQFSSIL